MVSSCRWQNSSKIHSRARWQKLDTIPFQASIPALTYSQARDVLIAQAIAVVSDIRIQEAGDWSVEPNSMDRLPDLARLAFMLKLIIRSPEPEIAKYLGVSPHEVQVLVEYAIDRLSVASPVCCDANSSSSMGVVCVREPS